MDWTKEAIEGRKEYIGGSDAAAILGLSRYKTPLEVWAIKTGQLIPPDIGDKVCVKLGNKLESTVAEFFTEETGLKVRRVNKTMFHPDHAFLGSNIDYEIVGEDALLECKTANQFKTSEWEDDDIPIEYIMQCIHYLAVTGKQRAYIAVLIGNMIFKWKIIDRDEKVVADLIKKEVEFWTKFIDPVRKGGNPADYMPMNMSSGDGDVLSGLYPTAAPESVIELDDQAQAICESLDSLKADKKVLEKEIEEQSAELKARLKTFETGVTAKYKITWKNEADNRLDTEKLKTEEPGIYEKYLNKKTKRVLRLSVKK